MSDGTVSEVLRLLDEIAASVADEDLGMAEAKARTLLAVLEVELEKA